jgi:hypothetical protein
LVSCDPMSEMDQLRRSTITVTVHLIRRWAIAFDGFRVRTASARQANYKSITSQLNALSP